MIRDVRLIRALLKLFDQVDQPGATLRQCLPTPLPGGAACEEHVKLLIDGKLIRIGYNATNSSDKLTILERHFFDGLTWEGHNLLDQLRDEDRFNAAYEAVAAFVSPPPMELVLEAIDDVLDCEIDEQTRQTARRTDAYKDAAKIIRSFARLAATSRRAQRAVQPTKPSVPTDKPTTSIEPGFQVFSFNRQVVLAQRGQPAVKASAAEAEQIAEALLAHVKHVREYEASLSSQQP